MILIDMLIFSSWKTMPLSDPALGCVLKNAVVHPNARFDTGQFMRMVAVCSLQGGSSL